MNVTDLHALVSERCAAKIREGKSPSKADLAWLEATQERPPSESSVEKSRNAKGDTQITVKVYDHDPLVAESVSDAIYDRQRARYPMQDGTVGGPVRDDADKQARAAAAIARSQAKAQGAKS